MKIDENVLGRVHTCANFVVTVLCFLKFGTRRNFSFLIYFDISDKVVKYDDQSERLKLWNIYSHCFVKLQRINM